MGISKGRALSATVNSATSIIKSSIDGTATISTLEQSAQQYANPAALPSVGNTFGEMALVQSTNRMYVWNGSGWYHVAIVNTNPSFTTSPLSDYTFDGDSPRNNITITVAATDPESLGVSFTFETGGQMDSMADITQDSSVFTLVPKGNDSLTEGASLTGTLTIKASDGVNIVPAVSEFTLVFVLTIENSSSNILLLKAVGTGNNTTPTDASTSNHSLTMAGATASLGTFSPYRSGGYSHSFDGSGDYLRDDTIADAFDTGAGHCDNFTIEMWILNKDATNTSNYVIGSNALSGGANDFILGTRKVFWNNAELADYGDERTNQYEWFHLVCVHEHDPSGGNNETVSVWINGRRTGRHTGLARISFANNTWAFGTEADTGNFGSLGNYHNGYIHDVKITKAALYGDTAVIPVPTELSTAHPTANIFHGFQQGFIDPRFTIGGNPIISSLTPTDYNSYDDTDGGSANFPGTSDEIVTTDGASNAISLGSGDFTVEFWIYKNNAVSSTWEALISQKYAATGGWRIYKDTGNGYLKWYSNSSSVLTTSRAVLRQNCWNHIALVRSSGTLTWYADGKAAGSTSNTTDYTGGGGEIEIGKGTYTSTYPTDAYITDVRLVAGTAVYTGDFTPPTKALTTTGGTYPSNTNINTSITAGHTKLLLNMTQAKIVDKSQNHNVYLSGAVASSAQQHFNENTMFFDNSNDYLYVEDDRDTIDFASSKAEDFVIECWIYKTSTQKDCWICQRSSSTVELSINLDGDTSGYSAGEVNVEYDSANYVFDAGILQNQWQHIAFVRTGNVIRWYTDGVLKDSRTEPASLVDIDVNFQIGRFGTSQFYYGGYIHDFRITRGISRFPYIAKPKILSQTNSGMEKPDGSFPTVSSASNTLFLIGHTNSIVDGSSNSTSITTHGNTQMSLGLVPRRAETGMNSIHFDGTGDYLSATTASALGTGDWTVEYWVWHDVLGKNQIHLAFGAYAPAFYYRHSSSTFKFSFFQQSAGLTNNVWTTYAPTPNKWYHLAWVHDDSENKLALYVNGSFWGDTTYTGNTTSTSLRVGDDTTSAWMDGNISNLRIVKEKLYDENFTPRTTAIIA